MQGGWVDKKREARDKRKNEWNIEARSEESQKWSFIDQLVHSPAVRTKVRVL